MFYEDVLRALTEAGVRFVLVGGTAVILHGVPRTTADLDIAVDLEEANLSRLVDALTRLGFRPRTPVPASDLANAERRQEWITEKGMRAFTFHRPGRPLDEVDVLIDLVVPFALLAEHAEQIDAGGLPLQMASRKHLIVMKTGTGRAQDAADVDALERLEGDADD